MSHAIPFVACLAALRLVVGAQAPDDILRFSGELTFANYEHMLEHAFDVPPGVERIDVTLEHSGKERRTVLDLGLRSPSRIRGWSGGRETSVHVSSLTATQGYLPGVIEPGRWAIILGVPNIRPESRDTYALMIRFDRSKPLKAYAPLRAEAGWYAGDLHLHSGHSDGRGTTASGKPMPAPVHRILDAAHASGLDFAALTDHNTGAHWLDIHRLQPYYDRLLLLHGREVTTYRGHANAVGERSLTDFALATPSTPLLPLLQRVTGEGAFLSINHPLRPDDESCMGCGWNDTSTEALSAVHGVEAVNGEDWKTSVYGWPFWAEALNRGMRLALVGGSDDHTAEDRTDIRPGSPTTMVYAAALSEPAIVEGLKAGRTYLRVRDPKGPSIAFTAEAGGRSFGLGESIPAGRTTTIHLQAVVAGAEGETLQWIRRGEPISEHTISREGSLRQSVEAQPGDWFSVVVADGKGPTLVTSAIYTHETSGR